MWPWKADSVLMAALFVIFVLLTTADAASCAKLGKVKSRFSKSPAMVTLVNKSGESRSVMWVDFNGGLVNYANLKSGKL